MQTEKIGCPYEALRFPIACCELISDKKWFAINNLYFTYSLKAGPIVEQSKSSDRGRVDPDSNSGGGRYFFYFLSRW